jgi:hypothetical protein
MVLRGPFGHRIEPTPSAFLRVRASARRVPLKLLGGQAVRLLCPEFPHRARNGQDMDFASVYSAKKAVIGFFGERGFLSDQRFNLLHGDRQMYFTTADGLTSVDVIMERCARRSASGCSGTNCRRRSVTSVERRVADMSQQDHARKGSPS